MDLLSCPLCLKPHFQGVDDLRSSLITVATSQISCPVCNEILMGLDKLTIHLFSHITHNLIQENLPISPPTNVEPPPPQPPTKKNQIKESSRKKSSEHYDQLIEESILTIPKESVTKKTLKCDICNFCFSDENILDMHQKLLHQTQVDAKTGQYSYHCHLCSKKFKMRGSLMVHLRVAHYGFASQELDGCNTKLANTDDNAKNGGDKMEKTVEGKQWVCDVCSKQFTTKYFLKKHKRLHTGEMPYYCAQCNKSFTFQQSYHKHMLYHSSEKPHLCSECGRAFKELSTLHNHERIHSGERPFVCETCGKSFRQRVSYLVHRRIHTGVMPYKCTACNKSFRYKISQKSHKCPANPPGSVVRAPVLLEKIEKNNDTPITPEGSNNEATINQVVNLYPQQQQSQPPSSNCIVRLNTDGNSNIITTTPTPNHINTIIFDSTGQIIGQNFAFDGQNLIAIAPNLITNEAGNPKINLDNDKDNSFQKYRTIDPIIDHQQTASDSNEDQTSSYEPRSNKSPDFFSMVLSPIIPDVQSLCLSNSPSSDHGDCSVKQEPLETINEESFKSLLDGLSNCI
ncbi:zinc finger protein [Holotrichia oblita]|uniref:Zinc finger protein n=1 Tax=Holotrichia oblita TaxID=644536 RepID=A0ACB9THR8_HOLOL|nr:zinc finger protein [Holotrichia oblita]